ncbi:FAD-binding oxidoreductase [Glutamicibacter mysorens]
MATTHAEFLDALSAALPDGALETSRVVLRENSRDFGQLSGNPVESLAVVFASSVADVQHVLRLATEYKVPVISRGAGTGVSGGVHVLGDAIVLNLSRMNRILEIRPEDEVAVVEPGVINHQPNEAVAELGLMYAPDTASYKIPVNTVSD